MIHLVVNNFALTWTAAGARFLILRGEFSM